ILGVAAAGVLAWSMGWFGGRGDATTKTAAIDPSASKTAPQDAKDAKPPAKVEPATPPAKVETPPVEPATPPKVEPATDAKVEPTTPPTEPTTPPVEPATPPKVEPTEPETDAKVEPATPPKVEPTTPPTVEPTTPPIDPGGSAVEPGLTAAIASRRVRLTEHLYVATQRDEPTTYSDARAICRKLEVDGVTGWRLPYRRELTAADIAGWLRDEAYWSRTRPDDDKGSVFVIDTATGELTVQPKDELASVTCVKKR
ncbi:MAG TPA: hypothetical protein VG755_43095, partial [Nannocystaceae bacterium]|nr:hypothetical protein [Nannocystaceae bacterium]